MTSNRPEQFVWFLDQLEAKTRDKSCVEVVVKIDDTDAPMNELLHREAAQRPIKIRYISTPLNGGFFNLWRSYDELLRLSDSRAYFVVGLNDEMCFDRPNWDDVLRRYVGMFPDNIFRLRTSEFRHRNYYDIWEAGWSNDTSSIMTKRWLEIGGGWCPCNGPDTFQQFVAYYFGWLLRFDRARPQREIPIEGIGFHGHGASLTLSGEALRRRRGDSIKPWFILVSHRMQEEAARRAGLLHAHIWVGDRDKRAYVIQDNRRRKAVELIDPESRLVLFHVKYRLSKIRITLTNTIRIINWGYYGGLGHIRRNRPITNLTEFLRLRYFPFDQFMTMMETRPRKERKTRKAFGSLQRLYWAGRKRINDIKRVYRDIKQVYRDSAGPAPVNRRLRYRIVWYIFRGARDLVRWGRVKGFPNISHKL